MTFVGHSAERSIILDSREPLAAKTRWIFTDISDTGFNWRNEDETADGTVTIRQRFVATRPAES